MGHHHSFGRNAGFLIGMAIDDHRRAMASPRERARRQRNNRASVLLGAVILTIAACFAVQWPFAVALGFIIAICIVASKPLPARR